MSDMPNPSYLYIGDVGIAPEGTHEAHLLICEDCGVVIEKVSESMAECKCRGYTWHNGSFSVKKPKIT